MACDYSLTMNNIDYLANIDFSTLLNVVYKISAIVEPTNIPISPVPKCAIGPVYHAWDMHGMITPNAHKNANSAANPSGRRDGWSHIYISYESKRPLRNMKCSVRTIAANTLDQ